MMDIDELEALPVDHRPNPNPPPRPRPKPAPKPAPKPPAPKKGEGEKEPPPAIPDEPVIVDTTKVNTRSAAFAAQSTAKLLVIVTTILAAVSGADPVAMTDEEAVNIAIPAVTILLRIRVIRQLFEAYGQYFLSLDEYILLAVAVFAYYERVTKELGRKKALDESTQQTRAESALIHAHASNGYGGVASVVTPPWRK